MVKIVIALLLVCISNLSHGAVRVTLIRSQNAEINVLLVGQNDNQIIRQTSGSSININNNNVQRTRNQDAGAVQPTENQNADVIQPITDNSRRTQGNPLVQQQFQGSSDVHATTLGSDYHFSWRRDRNGKYRHGDAVNYCRNLGSRWNAISIETREESDYINRVIDSDNVSYIWTSGTKVGNSWRWNGPGAGAFQGLNWGLTGGFGQPQPDNRAGDENCLGILNRFYVNDGITWHDIACFHLKPVACERHL
ncbi:uncharacterized protein LOC122244100 [Penaeus japonicus]|uniref:uncharacterized protein LOC122244100 n=1 Tax=Penaeus japonicus TaxID=27405 RepID=UPI001C711FF5|nr:uncharacterized protein LOC122244100 [Penaeus japonicus]